MLIYAVGYLTAALVFVLVDMIWLSAMAPRFYKPIMGDIALAGFNFAPAAVFYLIYPVGLMIFAVSPALKGGSLATAAMYGALLGFFSYATYDLTNQATLRNWSLSLTLVDVAWGTVLGAVAAAAGYAAASRFAA
jgi:uncharacterized membrane protein